MRTLLLLTLTLAVLLGGFATFLWLSPGPAGVGPAPVATGDGAPVAAPAGGDSMVGASRDGWTETYDKQTGRLAMMFRADRFTPAGGRSVDVLAPHAKIFTADGYIQLVAGRGKIDFPQAAGMDKFQSSVPAGMPERGELFDVTLALYETADAAEPALTAKLNNVTFDNDTFRIATAAAEIDGREVPADQIPVTVRGRDLDFDGRGLLIRWSEADRRLALLEIAHGGTATIKNADRLMPEAAGEAPTASGRRSARPLPDALASADPKALPPLPETDLGPAYRSTFLDDVRIAQSGVRVASADRMSVDFATENPKGPAADTVTKRPAKAEPATAPTSAPATRPAQPVTVEWTGRLRVVPLPADAPRPTSPADRTVMLTGSPVLLTQDNADVRAGDVVFHALDGTGEVTAGAYGTVTVTRPDADVRTEKIALDPRGATLLGTGRVTMAQGEGGRPMTARWADRCRLAFREGTREVESAALAGAVDVALPDLRLASDQLDLKFAELSGGATRPATQPGTQSFPPLQRIDARGSVRCVVTSAAKPEAAAGQPLAASQTINADALTVLTKQGADGRPVPDVVQARGNVHAAGDAQKLWADALDATVAPTADGKDFALTGATAAGNVRASFPNGGHAAAGKLAVADAADPADGQVLTLTAAGPDTPASLGDATSTLSGPQIVLHPKTGRATVAGAGAMHGLSKPAADAPPRAVDVTWTKFLKLDGPADRVDVAGDVRATSADADGTVSTATAASAVITLADDPAKLANASTRPVDPRTAGFAALSNKLVKSAVLNDGVELKSVLAAADGTLLRRAVLQAPTAEVYAADRRFVVPVAGRLLYEDHRPAPQADAGKPADSLSGYRGATAAAWHQRLTFDDATGRVTLVGDVRIARQPAGADAAQGRLNVAADQVSAVLTPAAPSADQASSKYDLSQAAATGNVQVRTPKLSFEATDATYDAAAGVMVATDGDLSAGPATRGRFRELRYNTRTDQIDQLTGLNATASPRR